MTEADALRVLNVEPGATPAQIRQAYLDLVKVWHPDRFEHDVRLRERAVRTLQEINDAYALLQRGAPAHAPGRDAAPPPPNSPPASEPPPQASPRTNTSAPATASEGSWISPRNMLAAIAAVVAGIALGLLLMRNGDDAKGTPSPEDVAAGPVPSPAAATPGRESRTPTAVAPGADRSRLPRADVGRSEPAGPESGTELRTSGTTGRGAVNITNRAAVDAVVLLTADAGHHRALYIRRGEKVSVLNLPPADYRARAALGSRWNGQAFATVSAWIERRDALAVSEGLGRPAELTLDTAIAGWRTTEPFSLP